MFNVMNDMLFFFFCDYLEISFINSSIFLLQKQNSINIFPQCTYRQACLFVVLQLPFSQHWTLHYPKVKKKFLRKSFLARFCNVSKVMFVFNLAQKNFSLNYFSEKKFLLKQHLCQLHAIMKSFLEKSSSKTVH